MAEEKIGLERLKEGTIVTIYFKEGFGRPKKQRFKFLGLMGKPENCEVKDGYYVDGFVILAEAIDLDGKEIFKDGKQIPQTLFPHTIDKLETDSKAKEVQ